jgi:hypothetical protein
MYVKVDSLVKIEFCNHVFFTIKDQDQERISCLTLADWRIKVDL